MSKQPTKESAKTTRQRAEEARKAAEAAQRRVDNRNRAIGAVIVIALVLAIFGGVYYSKRSNDTPVNPSAALPATVTSATYGVPYGTGTDKVPQLQIWEDFQCPICGDVEKANGTGITGLADQGKIRLLWRPSTIIDTNQNNDASIRATAAWGCAIDAGKAHEYHSTVFANQPATEGAGWTNAQLIAFGKTSGITGAAFETFSACVSSQKYAGWPVNSQAAFDAAGISGTPTGILVLGDKTKEITAQTLATPAALQQAITDFQKS